MRLSSVFGALRATPSNPGAGLGVALAGRRVSGGEDSNAD